LQTTKAICFFVQQVIEKQPTFNSAFIQVGKDYEFKVIEKQPAFYR